MGLDYWRRHLRGYILYYSLMSSSIYQVPDSDSL